MSLGSRIILFSSLYFLGFPPKYSWVCTILKIRREQSLLWKYLGHIIPHPLSGCKPSMNQSPFPFQIYFPWLPLVMSEFPPCHVCPRLPLPNVVWLPTEHTQLRAFTNPLIYPTKQSRKVGIIVCAVKREGGEEMVFFSLNYHFTHPSYLPHNCISPPLAEWHGASYLTSVRLSSHLQKAGNNVQPPRSFREDDGIPLLRPLPGLLLPQLTRLPPAISGQRELARRRRKGKLS